MKAPETRGLIDQANAALEATRSAARTYTVDLAEQDRSFAEALSLALEDPVNHEAVADLCTLQATLLTRHAARLRELAVEAKAAAAALASARASGGVQ